MEGVTVITMTTLTADSVTTDSITLTDAAVAKAAELLGAEEGADLALRVAVKPGGCSGFSYDGNADVKVADFEEVLV
jgi:iron-sulfur cluster assembly protein/iron-sulfur cluster insertion protein